LQRHRVLAATIAGLRLQPLAASARTAGFASAAGELIAELQRALISPERLRSGLRAWAAQDVSRAPYARDVGLIYAAYVRELDRLGRVDSELHAWRALDALRATPGAWGAAPVFFYGFDDLTALERDAIETLARVANAPVTVSLTYEPGRQALAARAEVVEELRQLATQVTELPALDVHYAPGSRRALHHLERHLFEEAQDTERIDPSDAISLLEAGGELAEAELVAERVLELLRAGFAADEIAVVHRSPASVAPLLRRVFAAYGISLDADEQRPFAHLALGRALLGAARCALAPEQATAADLVAFLRAPGLFETPEVVDGIEAQIAATGVRGAQEARGLVGFELPELDALATAGDQAAAVCRLARRLQVAPHRRAAPVLSAAAALEARALAALQSAVQELGELGLAPRGDELVELLESLTVAGGAAGADPGAVLLAGPLQVRARRFRAVFVCGLQEGAFPLPQRPEPFLPDQMRFELATASGLRLRPRENGLAAERHLFYAAVSRATERVVLSFRSCDEEGNLELSSPFVADVSRLLEPDWADGRRRRLLADVVWEPSLAPTPRELARALAASGAPAAGELPEPARALGAAALARVRHTRILSAGALESYGECPVKWLVERELAPRQLEPDSGPILRGSLMHAVLEQLHRRLGEPLTESTLPRARELLHGLVAEAAGAVQLAPGAPEVVRAAAARAVHADLERYLAHEARTGSGWRTAALERRFGFDDADSLPPLRLGEPPEEVLLRGVIDRIDVDDRGHAIVRDYKSGAPRPGWAAGAWASDAALQAGLYMLVLRELTELEPVAGLYQPLRGDDLRARGAFLDGADVGAVVATDARTGDELDELLDSVRDRAVALAAALRAGQLTPCPQTCSRDGCAHPAICRSA
ncbi:MAG: PD-(D/E)XK nuclease family protein, partial [Solirubrobacteraceae bacterium]